MNIAKEAGKMMVTLSMIATAIYILVKHPKYWPAVIPLAFIMAIWVQLIYHLFKRVNVSDKGLTFDDNSTKSETAENTELSDSLESLDEHISKLENQTSSLSEQVAKLRAKDVQRSFASLSSASKTNKLSVASASYETPALLKDFIDLKAEAKDTEYDYASDPNYKELSAHINNEVLSNLGIAINLQMQWHHSDKLLKLDLEKDIHQAFNGEKVNFDVLNDIKKQVEKVDNDPHIPITFSKATNDLKKLEL